MTDRIAAQLAFLVEADKLKQVIRASYLTDGSRRENSGEHSWHLALYALVLADHAGPDVSIDRVIRMLILHDLVEIDAGDVPIHGSHDRAAQEARERAAADRIFGLLPPDLGAGLRAIWEEFEAAQSPDALFAKALDRVQPVIHNVESGGQSWIAYNVTAEQLETRVGSPVMRGAPALWDHVRGLTHSFFASRAD